MDLKTKLLSLPMEKTLMFIELFFTVKESVKDESRCMAMYYEKDYVNFLSKKMDRKEMEKQLRIMVPKTSFNVLIFILEVANLLNIKNLVKQNGGDSNVQA